MRLIRGLENKIRSLTRNNSLTNAAIETVRETQQKRTLSFIVFLINSQTCILNFIKPIIFNVR